MQVEERVRDAIGNCLTGRRSEVERILAELTAAGQLPEALKMLVHASSSTMANIHQGQMDEGKAIGYAQRMLAQQSCGFLTPADEPALLDLIEQIWNLEVTIPAGEEQRYAIYILELATDMIGSAYTIGVPETDDPDSVDPWWEDLDLVWDEYADLDDGFISVDFAGPVS